MYDHSSWSFENVSVDHSPAVTLPHTTVAATHIDPVERRPTPPCCQSALAYAHKYGHLLFHSRRVNLDPRTLRWCTSRAALLTALLAISTARPQCATLTMLLSPPFPFVHRSLDQLLLRPDAAGLHSHCQRSAPADRHWRFAVRRPFTGWCCRRHIAPARPDLLWRRLRLRPRMTLVGLRPSHQR